MSFKEPIPALSNVMDTKDNVYRLSLTGIRSLKLPGPGAVAHMSLHQKPTMSKSRQTKHRGQLVIPDLHRGTGHPLVMATDANRAGKIRQRRVGEGHIWGGLDSVNRLFAILLRHPRNPQKSAISEVEKATEAPV